jgi:membrane-associated protease RseP (regulator of RpoE activity)
MEYMRPMPVYAARQPRQRYWLHALLLLATCFTTLVMGARMQYNFQNGQPALSLEDDSVPYFPAGWAFSHPARLLGGLPFMATLMLFFMAHEMGHYLYCRRYGVYATLPFFIPMPTLIGTMGAVILIRSRIRSRTALFDIGIAGPISGFVVALSVLLASLGWSKPMQATAGQAEYQLGYPLIFHMVHRLLGSMSLVHGPAAGLPLDRLLLHPMAIAAWVGMLATSLNLLPGGQLDGGHIVFSIAPQAHKFISRLTILILVPMAYYLWTGWIVWAILLQVSSLRHPQVAELPRVSGGRTWLAFLALLMLACTLTLAPLGHHPMRETLRELWHLLQQSALYVRGWMQHWRGR